jgi:peptide deformylase
VALHDIVLFGDEVLRRKGDPVDVFDRKLARLVDDMFETMYHAEGVGLAAPQIGVSKRICVIDVRDEDLGDAGRVALINPEIIGVSKKTDKASEGCLSIPGLDEFVTRPEHVVVRAQDVSGSTIEVEGDGLFSRAIQHEIDHLEGILFIDRVSPLKRRMLLKKWKKILEEDA